MTIDPRSLLRSMFEAAVAAALPERGVANVMIATPQMSLEAAAEVARKAGITLSFSPTT